MRNKGAPAAGTVLVTGATGTVGSAVVSALADADVSVRAIARNPETLAGRASSVQAVRADLSERNDVAAALDGVQRLFLLTPLEQDMAGVAARVIEQAHAAGVVQIVRLSVFGAGRHADTRLASFHRETEQVLESCGVPWASLRPNAFMQNTISYFAESIRRDGVFHAPQGQGRVSLIDVRDIAAVAVSLLTDPRPSSRSYELTGPEALSNYEVADQLSRALGRPVAYVDVDPEQTRRALAAQGMPLWLLDIVMDLYAFSATGGAARVSSDVQKVLGRKPITFRQFARDHADAFR